VCVRFSLLGRPERYFRKALCFSRDVFFISSQDLRAPLADRTETLPHDQCVPEFCNASPKFRGLSPKNFGAKTCKISGDFTQLPTWIANISGTIPSAFDKRSPVNFGPPSRMCVWIHPNRLFRETIYLPSNFIRAKDSLVSAHNKRDRS